MKKKKGFLYYLYYALGEKSHPHCNKTADRVALIRLVITSQILITNFFIIGGVIINVASIARHWNRPTTINVEVHIDEAKIPEYQTPPMKMVNRPLEFE